jgi:hypothetical protein
MLLIKKVLIHKQTVGLLDQWIFKMLDSKQSLKPWYKQFWPCFLFFFPLTAVVAGVITFFIAQNNSPVLVSGNYYKEGLAINANKRLQERAVELGLSARIVATPTTLSVHINGLESETANLFVKLQHPAFDELDKQLVLSKITKNVFQTPLDIPKTGKWYISIKGQTNEWEINQSFVVSEF